MLRTVILLATSFTPALCLAVQAQEEPYTLGKDSERHEGVPQGRITKHQWTSKVFDGTVREYWVYVPAQYDGSRPASVMVFQDGHSYVNETGQFRVPVVFDNLIHQGTMPVTIGIFINPGHKAEQPPQEPWRPNNRSFEYDTLSDQYARFLLEEILPEVGKQYKLTDDPAQRAIGGISSGGICAFTVAWQRPDAFQKVLSHVGSFVNIRGGHDYEAQIRKTPNKPIRVFLQDGERDLDNQHGNWWLANRQMEASLKFKGYDYKFVGGTGGHNGKHGGAILPDSLRWLWRPSETQSAAVPEFKPVLDFLQLPANLTLGRCSGVAIDSRKQIYLFHRGPQPILCFDAEGRFLRSWGDDVIGTAHGLRIDRDDNVWVTDIGHHQVFKFSPEGKLLLTLGQADKPGLGNDQFDRPTDIAFGPDGELYITDGYGNSRVMKFAAKGEFLKSWGTPGNGPGEFNLPHTILLDRQGRLLIGDRENKRIQIFDRQGQLRGIWEGFSPYGLAMDASGLVFMADGVANQVHLLDPSGKIARSWGQKGAAPGQFDLPHMLATDPSGNLYIAEVANQRLQKLLRQP